MELGFWSTHWLNSLFFCFFYNTVSVILGHPVFYQHLTIVYNWERNLEKIEYTEAYWRWERRRWRKGWRLNKRRFLGFSQEIKRFRNGWKLFWQRSRKKVEFKNVGDDEGITDTKNCECFIGDMTLHIFRMFMEINSIIR